MWSGVACHSNFEIPQNKKQKRKKNETDEKLKRKTYLFKTTENYKIFVPKSTQTHILHIKRLWYILN